VLALIACLFVFTVAGWAAFAIGRVQLKERLAGAQVNFDAHNKVGKWYQERVEELENENRQLAEQIIASGAIRHIAMPVPPRDDDALYASDATGLVVERLDPRDIPLS
jgi:hypothetical protein